MKTNLMADPHFDVVLNTDASSPNPIRAIWMHQHSCVAKRVNWVYDPQPSSAGMFAAIKEQMMQKHWDVLEGAFASIQFMGFPHASAMQWRTHGRGILVQSFRYTGEQLEGQPIEEAFYCRDSSTLRLLHEDSIENYQALVALEQKAEVARDVLTMGVRQGFSVSKTVREWFHLLDRRLLMDTQDEARCGAEMALMELETWCPEIFGWYRKNRAGRNMMSP